MSALDVQKDESDTEPTAPLTPRQRYQQSLSSIMSGVGMGTLEARRRLPRDVDALMGLRLLRALGEVGPAQGKSAAVQLSAEQKVRVEAARRKHLRRPGLYHRYARLACRELARREGLEALPEDSGRARLLGLGVSLFDMLLRLQGVELGAVSRSRILKELEAEGVLESARTYRWFKFKTGAPELSDEDEQFRSRFLFLSSLNMTVIQRFQGAPGFLKFMGFIGSEEDRRGMLERLHAGIWAKLQALAVPLWSVKPGDEGELLCLVVGLTGGVRYGGQAVLQESQSEELVQTVLADLVNRLGPGEDARSFLVRMLADRALEEFQEEEVTPANRVKQACQRLGITDETLRKWRVEPSCEEGDVLRPFAKTVLPDLMIRVFSLVQERWPEGLKVVDIKDYAIRNQWPRPLQEGSSIELACTRLVGLHMLASYSERQPDSDTYLRAFVALGPKGDIRPAPVPNPKDVVSRLRQLLELLSYPEGGEMPRFHTHQVIIRRADFPAFEATVEALRESERRRVEDVQDHDTEMMGNRPVGTIDSLSVIHCSAQQIGMKLPNSRYT